MPGRKHSLGKSFRRHTPGRAKAQHSAKQFGSSKINTLALAGGRWECRDHYGTLQQLSPGSELAQGRALGAVLIDCITPGSNSVKSSAQLYFVES